MSDAEVISFGQDSNVEEALERKMSDEKEDVMASSKGNEFMYFFLTFSKFYFHFHFKCLLSLSVVVSLWSTYFFLPDVTTRVAERHDIILTISLIWTEGKTNN